MLEYSSSNVQPPSLLTPVQRSNTQRSGKSRLTIENSHVTKSYANSTTTLPPKWNSKVGGGAVWMCILTHEILRCSASQNRTYTM
eukprot:scaffold6608_cov162-Pinguiococcus_pyrenoidosus.AAC.1